MTDKNGRRPSGGNETMDAQNVITHSQQEAPGAKPMTVQNVEVTPAPKPRPKQ